MHICPDELGPLVVALGFVRVAWRWLLHLPARIWSRIRRAGTPTQ